MFNYKEVKGDFASLNVTKTLQKYYFFITNIQNDQKLCYHVLQIKKK